MTIKRGDSGRSKEARNPFKVASLFGRRWEAQFDEPKLSSDAGLTALVSSGIANGLLANFNAALDDPRKGAAYSTVQRLR